MALLALVAVTQGRAQDRRAPALGATVERVASAALRGAERFAITVPPGYATNHRRYPVVYLLHGLPDDGTGFRTDRVGRFAAIAAARGRPVIVVAPQGARKGDTDGEWHDWGPGRDWETAVAEVVRRVDTGWRTIADRRARALVGISAGGYGAAAIGLHRPGTFSVIESWSGYFRPTTPDGSATLDVGTDADDRIASAHSFVGCLARLERRWRPRYFGFYVGSDDGDFLADNERLHAELARARVPHRFAVYRGGHTSAFWAAHEPGWLAAALARLSWAPRTGPGDARRARAAARRARCPGA